MDVTRSATAIIVYIRHEPTKTDRQVILPSGSTLAALKQEIKESFNDLIKLEYMDTLIVWWFDGKEYVELQENQVLKDKDKVKVHRLHWVKVGPIIPHPINDKGSYTIWSLISQQSDCLLKKQSPTDNKILCNGRHRIDPTDLVEFKTTEIATADGSLFVFALPSKQANKVYAIKGQGEDTDVIVEEIIKPKTGVPATYPTDEYRFDIQQSFSYSQFRCSNVKGKDNLYLNASKDGSVKLTKAGQPGYPDPDTLFIVIEA